MKAARVALLIFGITRVTVYALLKVRLVVKQQSSLKRTPPTKFEVFATRRLAFLKQRGDVFRIHRPGISGSPGTISLESNRLPGFYLKQHGYKFRVNEEGADDDFGPISQGQDKLSSFIQLRRETVPGAAFFELEDRPGWFICHESPPKLILRAREINRTPNFDNRCAFFIEQTGDLEVHAKNKSSKVTGRQSKVQQNRIKRKSRKGVQAARSHGKYHFNQGTEMHGGKSIPGIVRGSVSETAKSLEVQYNNQSTKHNAKTLKNAFNATMVTKQKAADVLGKKDSTIGLPIIFSTVGMNMRKLTDKSGNDSTVPVTEVLDPHTSAHESDSMLALHADKIIEELEKNELKQTLKQNMMDHDDDQINFASDDRGGREGEGEPPIEHAQTDKQSNRPLVAGAPDVDYQDEMQLVQQQKEQRKHLVSIQDEEERQRLINHLIDVQKDKCLSMIFHNKIGKRYRLVSSFNPRGYRPKGIEFSLKAIFKEYRKKDTVIFKAIDDAFPTRSLLLNGNKELYVDLGTCIGKPFSVEVTSPVKTGHQLVDDVLPNFDCPSMTPHAVHDSNGHCCVFPFLYKGVRYRKCVAIDSDWPWCGLSHNYDKDKLWGYCAIPVMHSQYPKEVLCPWHCLALCSRKCPVKCCFRTRQPKRYQAVT